MKTLARVESVNVGERRSVSWAGRIVGTGIWKSSVEGRVGVRGVNLDGDDQADRRVHGGQDKAVYAYSAEDYAWWSERLGSDLSPGTFGENLTVSGHPLDESLVGERWQVGTTVLEVSQPRLPCFKLGIRMDDPTFPDLFEQQGRLGVYLRIIEEGDVGAGDRLTTVSRPDHGLTAYDIARAYPHASPDAIELLLSVDELPVGWREWAERVKRRSAV